MAFNNSTTEEKEIIQEVLDRMDEICPEDDINEVEGQLIYSLIDPCMNEFVMLANIHKIPFIKTEEYNDPTDANGPKVTNCIIECPGDYMRLYSVECADWGRVLYESDLADTTSMDWKMKNLRHHEPTKNRPFMVALGMSGVSTHCTRIECKPFSGKNKLTLSYVPTINPRDIIKEPAENEPEEGQEPENTEPTTPAETANAFYLGNKHPFWQAYIWYLAGTVLTSMGQGDLAAVASQHAQQYNIIPNGLGGMAQNND